MVELQLSRGKVAVLDDEDGDLARFKWSYATAGYAFRTIGSGKAKRLFYLHRLILERIIARPLVRGEETDHINRNKLDNRRCNLRVVNRSQNVANSPRRRGARPFRGVAPIRGGGFSASITKDNQFIYLGRFDTAQEAAVAYNAAAREMYDGLSVTNEIDG